MSLFCLGGDRDLRMSTAKCFLGCGELPCFFSETGSPVGQNGLELTSFCGWGGPSFIPPMCWDGRCVPPHLVYTVFEKWRVGFLVLGKHSANLLPSSASRLLFERHFVLISHSSKQETSAETGDIQILPWDIFISQDLRWVRVVSYSLSSKLQDPPCCLEIQLHPFPTPQALQAS